MLAYLIGPNDHRVEAIRRLFGSTVPVRLTDWDGLEELLKSDSVPELVIVLQTGDAANRNGIRWLASTDVPTIVVRDSDVDSEHDDVRLTHLVWPVERDAWWAAVRTTLPDTHTLSTPTIKARPADTRTASADLNNPADFAEAHTAPDNPAPGNAPPAGFDEEPTQVDRPAPAFQRDDTAVDAGLPDPAKDEGPANFERERTAVDSSAPSVQQGPIHEAAASFEAEPTDLDHPVPASVEPEEAKPEQEDAKPEREEAKPEQEDAKPEQEESGFQRDDTAVDTDLPGPGEQSRQKPATEKPATENAQTPTEESDQTDEDPNLGVLETLESIELEGIPSEEEKESQSIVPRGDVVTSTHNLRPDVKFDADTPPEPLAAADSPLGRASTPAMGNTAAREEVEDTDHEAVDDLDAEATGPQSPAKESPEKSPGPEEGSEARDSVTEDHEVLVWVVEREPARLYAAEEVVGGVRPVTFGSWLEAELLLSAARPPDLLIVGFEVLQEMGPDNVRQADEQLCRLGVGTIVLHEKDHGDAVARLREYSGFDAFLGWPVSISDLRDTVVEVEPLLSELGGPGSFASDTAHLTPVDWLELDALEEFDERARVVAATPSLSQGQLADLPLARLLHLLAVQRRTGVLTLKRSDATIALTVDDGRVGIDDTRGIEPALIAFAWEDAEFSFHWERVQLKEGTPIPEFVFQGIQQADRSPLLGELASLENAYPVFTTELLRRASEYRGLGNVWTVATRCTGREKLQELLRAGALTLEELQNELLFCIATDAVAMLPTPSLLPAGFAYRLEGRLDDVDAVSSPTAARSQQDFSPEQTRGQIASFDSSRMALLKRMESMLRTAIEQDPYAVLSLEPGCGAAGAADQYRAVLESLPAASSVWLAPPLRVTMALVTGALASSYFIVLSEETDLANVVGQPSSMTAAEEAWLGELELTLEALTDSPFELLGVERDAPSHAMEEAFDSARQALHPRQTVGMSPAVQHVSGLVFASLLDVEGRLRRAAPDKPLTRAGSGDPEKSQDEAAAETLEPRKAAPRGPTTHTALSQLAYAERSMVVDLEDLSARVEDDDSTDESSPGNVEVPVAPEGEEPARVAIGRIVPLKRRQSDINPPPQPAPDTGESSEVLEVDETGPGDLGESSRREMRKSPRAPQPLSRSLRGNDAGPPNSEMSNDECMRRGREALDRGQFNRASQYFEAALQQDESDEARAYAVWAQLLMNPEEADEAQRELQELLNANRAAESVSCFLGILALRDGEPARAVKYLRRTLMENPGHAEATRSMRLAKMRLRDKSSDSGFLSRLFKK